MALVPTDERKDTLKKYGKLWNKIRDLIKSITNNADNCDKNIWKSKFNSDDNLPLKKIRTL